ncbi:MAG: hypothetical protein DMF47_03720 [Verrucomicrobia bacterium]|nr:MAG: hypothetical protein DMF47_03720 [Verrucomicrobiota bacterium]
MARSDDILLTAEELRLRRRKRRIWLVVILLFVLAIVVTFFGARPASNAIKAWQARRHAERAFAYIDNAQWNEAQKEAIAGYQLQPGEPQALRAVARFLSRVHQPEALDFWKQLQNRQSLTREDRRDEVNIALAGNDLSVAEVALKDLLTRKDSPASAADWLLAAQVARQKNETNEARKLAQKVLDDSRADERTQFQAVLLTLAIATPENTDAASIEAAWARLSKLAEGKTKAALDALVVLAQRALSRPEGTGSVPSSSVVPSPSKEKDDTHHGGQAQVVPPNDLVRALENHPLAKTPHKLLALDLQMHADPTQRDALISRAIADWKDADAASLVALATWLDGKGEYQRQLDTIPLERALQSRDVFLQHLDALGALDRWSEIKQLLESEHFPLDEVVQRMYIARCNARLGEKTASENNWKRALEAAGGDSGKLMTLAEYAERNGANEMAEVAYATATNESPKLRAAWQGRLRLAQSSGGTKKIHAVLAGMLTIWPNDSAIQNDEAYMRLLLLFLGGTGSVPSGQKDDTHHGGQAQVVPPSEELNGIEHLAEKLVQQNPTSLPHRTLLALARLEQHRPAAAIDVYSNIKVAPNTLSPSALVVHAAVLEANGHHDDAMTEAQIPPDKLLPEERDLIQGVTNGE